MRLNRTQVARLFRDGLTIKQVCEKLDLRYNGYTRKLLVTIRPPDVVAKRGRRPYKKKPSVKCRHRQSKRMPVPAEVAELRDALVDQWSRPYDPDRLAQLLTMLQAAVDYHRKPSVDARRRQV